jgi:hypothetical protein
LACLSQVSPLQFWTGESNKERDESYVVVVVVVYLRMYDFHWSFVTDASYSHSLPTNGLPTHTIVVNDYETYLLFIELETHCRFIFHQI